MALPITHRLDAPIVYISVQDDAWDMLRVRAERQLIERALAGELGEDEVCPWQSQTDHPFDRYVTGKSRFDVSSVREYLLAGSTPIEFHMRRLKLRQWIQVSHLNELGRFAEARILAMSLAIVEIKGADIKLDRLGKQAGQPLTDACLDELRALFGDTEFGRLGTACIAASRELDDAEKKL